MNAALKNYVNMEINRMLTQEKPKAVYMAKLPRNQGMQRKGTGNTHLLRMWKKGFVTERLQWKCRKNGIRIVEVIGRGIGRECSACGQTGYVDGEKFKCPACGFEEKEKSKQCEKCPKQGKKRKTIKSKMVKRYTRKINRLGSLVLPRLRVSGDVGFALAETLASRSRDNGDCGGRYLDIKDKTALGYEKQVRRYRVNSYPWLHGN